MTSEDVRSELERQPFTPFRLHLVSGKELDVRIPGAAYMLQNTLLVLHDPKLSEEAGYDMFALRNIERLERFSGGVRRAAN
jgi:hypothetical protein